MKSPVDFFRTLAAMVSGPPPFRFNHELYQQLVRKCDNGRVLTAPVGQPEVEFTAGPVDGSLGCYSFRTNKIHIDALEIYLSCVQEGFASAEELRQKFDDRLTKTLAHEGGHWHLEKRYGVWPWLQKWAIAFVLLTLGTYLTYNFFHNMDVLLSKFVVSWIGHWSFFGGKLVAGLLFVAVASLLLLAARHLLLAYQSLAFAITYRICWHERFAREFAERVDHNPEEWDKVIEI